jgi:hypothetical protein
MTAERTSAKFYLENKKPLSEYEAELRKHKTKRAIYLDHCIDYVNSRDFSDEVKKNIIKRLKSKPKALFNDIYPKLDSMLTQEAIKIANKYSKKVKDISKNVFVEKEKVTADALGDIYDALTGEEPIAQEQPAQTEEVAPSTEELQPDPEAQLEIEQQEKLNENF